MNPDNCWECPAGTFNNEPGSPTCTDCADGYFAHDNGTVNCYPCQAGEQSSLDHTYCTTCEPGYFSPGGQQCELCSPGTFSLSQAGECTNCQAGTYNSYQGQSLCSPCGSGYYSATEGSTSINSCLICPSGKYCPDQVTSSPTDCPEGSYCLAGYSQPVKCKSFFTSSSGSSFCSPNKWLYIIIVGGTITVILGIVIVWKYSQSRKYKKYEYSEISRLIPQPDGPEYQGF